MTSSLRHIHERCGVLHSIRKKRLPESLGSKKPVQQAVGLDGLKVSVSKAASSGVEKSKTLKAGGLAGLTSKVSVKQIRKEIGNNGLRQASIDAGRKPPSDRPLCRWAQQGRIPHIDVAERVQRRAASERLGGIGKVAKKISRSPSAVSRCRSGEANDLRADAKRKFKEVKDDDIMERVGVLRPDGTPKKGDDPRQKRSLGAQRIGRGLQLRLPRPHTRLRELRCPVHR